MNIVIASDSYKESLSSLEVAQQIKKAFKEIFPKSKISTIALADGGEGTVDALIQSCQGQSIETEVKTPLNKSIKASYGKLNNNTAVIEMAMASGLHLLKQKEKNPLNTSSYGFGQLIEHARLNGAKKIILGIGGSATNDAGIGMLQAMGVRFFDKDNTLFNATTKNMQDIKYIDDTILQKNYKNILIEVACDVNNPLCGKKGASYTFAKQKGANEIMIEILDKKLLSFSKICQKHFNKKTKNKNGAGAAGGVGFALHTFLNAKLQSGIDIVMKQIKLKQKIKKADLIITGEGKIDAQTIDGKTISGVASIAKKYNKPLIVIAGCSEHGYEKIYEMGVDAVFDITPMNISTKQLFKDTKYNLYLTSKNIASVLKMTDINTH